MPVKKIGGKWIVDVWIVDPDGERQRFRRRSPFKTKKETEAFERELVEDVLSTWYQPEERRFEDHAIEFLTTYAKANNKHSEVVTKESILRVHLIPAFGDLLLTEIGSMVIERYKAAKLANGLKPKTINNQLAVLRKALIVASEWGLLDSPPRVKQMKVAKPPFDFLDHEEADRLVAAADGPFRTLIITACKTGLRLGELRALRWEDVDLVSQQLMVRQSVSRGVVGTPKSNRERVLPLCDTALFALKAERHLRGELVFCKEDGRRFTKSETYGGLQRACRLAGLRRIGWHVLRHTFASHLAMAGVPLKAVQELLGHANMEMTLRYAHLSPEARRQAVCALDRAPVLPSTPSAAHGPGVGGTVGGAAWGGGSADARPGIGSQNASGAEAVGGVAGGGLSSADRPALRLAKSPNSSAAPFPAVGGGE